MREAEDTEEREGKNKKPSEVSLHVPNSSAHWQCRDEPISRTFTKVSAAVVKAVI